MKVKSNVKAGVKITVTVHSATTVSVTSTVEVIVAV
jgi:hypothetical protein